MQPAIDARRRRTLGSLLNAVARREGVARVSSLQRDGYSRHYIRLAISTGALVRVRRDWVATPAADPDLVSCARRGVVTTCVSSAQRLGLWVLDPGEQHVAAARGDRVTVEPGTRVHWASPVVPRDPEALVDPVENALVLVASCQPHDAALAIWDSALRQGMVDRRSLARLDLSGAARALLEEAHPFADSGLETIFVARMKRLAVAVRSQIWIAGHHVDHLIGELLVVQIDGGHHVDAQRIADNKHDAALRLLGFTVFRFGYREILDDWPSVQWAVMQAIAQGLHRPH
ncbi:DUF559 domain-containing protein [Microbacterium sp. NPDC019599]|uniref:endonuclease domain-containing protein n=1 Tax=Microbacterium sp. NPDC019599 TaxID=3154690 RepID=UPI0033F6654B